MLIDRYSMVFLFNNGFYGQDIVMAFSPPEDCRLFVQKKAYQGGGGKGHQHPRTPPSYAPVMKTCIPWFIFIIVQVSVSRFVTLKQLFKPHVKHSPYSRMFSSSMSPSKALTVVLGSKFLFELTWLIASWKAFHSWLLLLFDNRATRLRK